MKNMIHIKSMSDIAVMHEGGAILADVRRRVALAVHIGTSLQELNDLAEALLRKAGAQPAFLGYRPSGARKSYPATICASVNEVIVHGIPTDYRLKSGDVLKIDFGAFYKGWYTDTAVTVGVGKVSREATLLIKTTNECLDLAIRECVIGNTLGDIGATIEKHARKHGLCVVERLTGHGIGRALHEQPDVLNYGQAGKGMRLEEGMVIAIEPMLSVGRGDIEQLPDESYGMVDKSLSAQFEHTIAIIQNGPIILTE